MDFELSILCGGPNNECLQGISNNISDTNCHYCPLDSCLSGLPPATCQTLNTNIGQCHSMNSGYCSELFSGNCIFCPQMSCLNEVDHICIKSTFQQQGSTKNLCLLEATLTNPCKILDMDTLASTQNLYFCALYNDVCANMTTDPRSCVRCPHPFTQPGNHYCYKINNITINDTANTSTSNQVYNTYFGGLRLIKVRQDCSQIDTKNAYINTCSASLICQQGCFTCSSIYNCTTCISGFFLYNVNGAFQCIQCPSASINDLVSNPLPFGLEQITCADCYLGINDWSIDK